MSSSSEPASGGMIARSDLRERLHDLRQPLQAARLFHGLLARQPHQGKEAEHLERLGQALDALEKQVIALQSLARGQG